jgi:HAD superfamily hydrolase (TIGR01509 family)
MIIKAVIFDLDGTLTAPILDFDQIRREMGIDEDQLDILAAMSQMTPQQRQAANEILHRHEQHAADNACLNDGVHEVLEKLRQMKLPVGLLTRNTMENVKAVISRYDLQFDAIIDRQTKPSKPDGFGVRKLCRQFGVEPAQTIVVGDFVHDLHAANDAGAIAVLYKSHKNAEDFEQYADFTIVHLYEIFDIIDQTKG